MYNHVKNTLQFKFNQYILSIDQLFFYVLKLFLNIKLEDLHLFLSCCKYSLLKWY